MLTYTDREGNRITRSRWEKLVVDEAYCLVAVDPVAPDVTAVTRWTGISDSTIDQRPLPFVTALWRLQSIGSEVVADSMTMTGTEEEARCHHDALVRRW